MLEKRQACFGECNEKQQQQNFLLMIIVINVVVVLFLLRTSIHHTPDALILFCFNVFLILVFLGYVFHSTRLLYLAHTMVVFFVIGTPFLVKNKDMKWLYMCVTVIHVCWFMYNQWRCPMSDVRFFEHEDRPRAFSFDLPPIIQVVCQLALVGVMFKVS